ncbi:MAG: class I SAM-dependent methyltransferase [Deltaproteobacteria bacterium]|nr:class I SAM-dependent methyltransferase [Deltaproteobacteria bacterium]MBI4223740.1 class I SAM-dependent methyltransferase [Deltaproteobacteria bacterium]
MLRTNRPWGNPSSLSFFKEHRNSVEEAYPSELHFLEKVVPQVQSVLDVGCAAGGLYPVFKKYNPRLHYEGADVIPEMIENARKKFPRLSFHLVGGAALPFEDNSREMVFSSGLFHLIDHYEAYLQDLYRVARRFLLVDFRVHSEATRCSEMWVAFGGVERKEELKVPYYVLNMGDYLRMLTRLKPSPGKIDIYGYPGKVSANTKENIPDVLFLFANIEKGAGRTAWPEISLHITPKPQGGVG